jgi:hypothetical protein
MAFVMCVLQGIMKHDYKLCLGDQCLCVKKHMKNTWENSGLRRCVIKEFALRGSYAAHALKRR